MYDASLLQRNNTISAASSNRQNRPNGVACITEKCDCACNCIYCLYDDMQIVDMYGLFIGCLTTIIYENKIH